LSPPLELDEELLEEDLLPLLDRDFNFTPPPILCNRNSMRCQFNPKAYKLFYDYFPEMMALKTWLII